MPESKCPDCGASIKWLKHHKTGTPVSVNVEDLVDADDEIYHTDSHSPHLATCGKKYKYQNDILPGGRERKGYL